MIGTRNQTSAKRHCMIVHAYYPLGETRVEREAMALIDHGYEVDVVCLQDVGEPAHEVADSVHVYRLPVARSKRRSRFLQLLEYLAFLVLAFGKVSALHWRRRYGVVQAHNLPDFLVFAALGPKLMGARVILDIHDLMPDFFAAHTQQHGAGLLLRLVTLQERLSCWFADHVITVTDTWRETLIRRGVPPEKVSVVMNVADPRIFYRRLPDSTAVNGVAGRTNGHFNLIYHGTIKYHYGIDLIIRAVHKVRSAVPGIHLTLIGPGEALPDLERLARELGVEDCVEFSSNPVHASKLPERIAQADVGVVPNRDDAFTGSLLPTKLMEYVALGTPVIAARTPTISAYFDDSMVKFFRPGDADDLAESIIALYNNRSLLQEFVCNADRFNQTYSWASVSARYVQLIDKLNEG